METHPTPTEANRLEEIFGTELWRGKYKVMWCHACDTAVIACPECHRLSCTGGGCGACVEDQLAFMDIKTRARDYLTVNELAGYQKGLRLHRLILDSIRAGETEIPWATIGDRLSESDEELFSNLIHG